MKRYIISAVAALFAAVSAWAATEVVDGIEWKYDVKDGKAYLGSCCSSTWAISTSTAGAITIPSALGGYPVTGFGEWAFYGCSGLTSVTIPDSVTYIGEGAFYQCSGLTSVTIPDSVVEIDWNAFGGCRGLTSVTIGSGVKIIRDDAFSGLSGLSSFSVGADNTEYASESGVLFSKDMKLLVCYPACLSGEYVIPDSVTSIGGYAFYCCSGLTSVTIPDSVTSIGEEAFGACSGLTSVTIPDSVTYIREDAFSWCSGLKSVTIPNSVTFIGEDAFGGCALTSVYVDTGDSARVASLCDWPYGVQFVEVAPNGSRGSKIIGGFTWWYEIQNDTATITGVSPKIGDIVIPSMIDCRSVTSIGDRAFHGGSTLTSVTIPNSVTNIGSVAFYGCSGLTSVTIPDSVTSIGEEAFSGCSGLTSFVVADDNPDFRSMNGLLCSKDGKALIAGINGDVTIPNSVTNIGSVAFYGCSGLTSVTIPDSVTCIGKGAFYNCSGLTSFVVADDNPNFRSMNGLLCSKDGKALIAGINGDVTIPDSVTSIGESAFYGCSGLTSVTIPNSVTSVGDRAFYNCSGLTSFVVADDNPNFRSMNGLLCSKDGKALIAGINGDVTIPDSVTSIGDWAFYDCSGLTSLTIPDSVTSIGDWAFFGCSGMTTVYVDDQEEIERVRALYSWPLGVQILVRPFPFDSLSIAEAMPIVQDEKLDGKPVYEEASASPLLILLTPEETEELGYGYLTFKYKVEGGGRLGVAYDSGEVFSNACQGLSVLECASNLVEHGNSYYGGSSYVDDTLNTIDVGIETPESYSDAGWSFGRIKVLQGAAVYLFKEGKLSISDLEFEGVLNPDTTCEILIDGVNFFSMRDTYYNQSAYFHGYCNISYNIGEFAPIQKFVICACDAYSFNGYDGIVITAGHDGYTGASCFRGYHSGGYAVYDIAVVGVDPCDYGTFIDRSGSYSYGIRRISVDCCPLYNVYLIRFELGGANYDSTDMDLQTEYDPETWMRYAYFEDELPVWVEGCYDVASDRMRYEIRRDYSWDPIEFSVKSGYAFVGWHNDWVYDPNDRYCQICNWGQYSIDMYAMYYQIGTPVIYKDDEFNMPLPHEVLYAADQDAIDLAPPMSIPDGYRFVRWELIPWSDYDKREQMGMGDTYRVSSAELEQLISGTSWTCDSLNGCDYYTTNAIVAQAVWQELPDRPVVTINRADGYTFSESVRVGMSVSDPAAKIYYTLDGSEPTTNSTLYTASVTFKTSTRIRAIAYLDLDGYLYAGPECESSVYKLAMAPMISAEDEFSGDSTTVSILFDGGPDVYYTLDGSDPTPQSGLRYEEPFAVFDTTCIRAAVYFNGVKLSDYSEKQIVSLTPPDGSGNWITMASAEELDPTSRVVRVTYSVAGNSLVENPSVSIGVSAVIGGITNDLEVAEPLQIAAGTWSFDWDFTDLGCALHEGDEILLTLGECEPYSAEMDVFPVVSISVPDGTEFLEPLSVELTASVAGSTILYVMSETEDIAENAGTPYAGAINVSEACAISAIAISPSGKRGLVSHAVYSPRPILAPVISPCDGFEFSGHCEVTINPAAEMDEVVIYYTLDGSEPGTSSILYEGAFEIARSTTVKAVAWHPGASRYSPVVSAYIAHVWSYGVSVGQDDLVMTSSGDAVWERDREVSHDGHEALRSGKNGPFDPVESVLKTTLSGPVNGHFYWKASCECGEEMSWDYGVFAIDGVEIARIGGETDWERVSFSITNESAELSWTYFKDDWNDTIDLDDCIWIDELSWSTSDQAAVVVPASVTGKGDVEIPDEWFARYPTFSTKFGDDRSAAMLKPTGKCWGAGQGSVWHDYVAGTDPTNPEDKFTASITLVEGEPVIRWSPELSPEQAALRNYKIYGKAKLSDETWTDITSMTGSQRADYNFFKVVVEMK